MFRCRATLSGVPVQPRGRSAVPPAARRAPLHARVGRTGFTFLWLARTPRRAQVGRLEDWLGLARGIGAVLIANGASTGREET